MKSQHITITHKEIVDIVVEEEILGKTHTFLSEKNYTSLFILCDNTTQTLFLPLVNQSVKQLAIPVHHAVIPTGEQSKSLAVMTDILQQMQTAQLDRNSAVIALGGGVVGDIATLVAGLYYRGIDCIQIPTTLLSQVDSSIGGKGAIDVGHHKNTLGIIKQPTRILIDPSLLKSLPENQIRSGMGEICKYAIAQDIELFEKLENTTKIEDAFSWIINRCIQLKMNIVAKDPMDTMGIRHVLNFGHTVGQAIELQTDLLHGEAISIGMHFALVLSKKQLHLPLEDEQRILHLLQKFHLPITIAVDKHLVLAGIKQDKKSIGDTTQFILIEKIGKAHTQQVIPEILLKETAAEIFV